MNLEPVDPTLRPRLRASLSAEAANDRVRIADRMHIGGTIEVSPFGFEVLRHFDGDHTLQQVQLKLLEATGGQLVPLTSIAELAAGLDEALLLDSPRFREQIGGPVRKPSCIGCYPADAPSIRTELTKLFTAPGGPGLPEATREPRPGVLRAALLPHMDYGRGNITYGWGFKELIEQTDATVFVIIGTSHYSGHRFTLTRQHFETPLGLAHTNQEYIDRIVASYGEGLFDDPCAHIPEHSIELEVLLLQFLLEGKRNFTIVPLLTGSYFDCIEEGTTPAEQPEITRMAKALREAEEGCAERVCYLISGDLAHIGPKFGDEQKAAGPWLAESRVKDDAICADLEKADPTAYFLTIAAESDARRICGLPPTWLTLETIRPRSGKVLHYQQFIDPQGHESVSFAAAAFYA